MLRQHSPPEGLEAIRMARDSGFENLNVDLILGFPGQTGSGFLSGLRQLIRIQPDHFSIYLLEIHEQAPLQRLLKSGKLSPMPEEEQIHSFEAAISILTAAGYEHYEVSNFALENKMSVHNLKYWNDLPYYGYGAGACSYYGSVRIRNISDVSKYIEAVESGRSSHEESTLETEETRARNALIFGLRKVGGIDVKNFEISYGRDPSSLFDEDLERFLSDGLLELTENHLRLTRKGLLLSNEVLISAIG
jgi:oxygen-independent coproporphyrinogen-3 oxidase